MSELLQVYKRVLRKRHESYGRRKSPSRVYTEAELIWTGEHYLIVREGPYDGRRSTVLVDRGGLMLLRGNKNDSALEAIALSTLHPVMIERVSNRRVILHQSGKDRDGFGQPLFKGRWSKALVARLIDFGKQKDANYVAEVSAEETEFEQKNRRSQQAVEIAKEVGCHVYGTSERNGIEWPAGEQFEIHTDNNYRGRLGHFYVDTFDGELSITLNEPLNGLTMDQFERLLVLLREIKGSDHSRKEAI